MANVQPTTEDIMKSIPLTPQVIGQFTDFLVNPKKYNCDYKPLPKVVFYIIMREQFPEYFGKDDREGTRHDLGYKLKLVMD